ncbi:LiaF transmembrane domain-containing protein [Alicyclobacillus ferrooxydans]|uniref:Cell wall-active antibiotics response LiaF-like C-terminal domain-containing protein n=1 Tax=Alicyclobacillus ferrooxydans TaxID=471514 RepID=A0A0P9CVU5_9BACL|nr:LiaF domain-containing protein [Alicyclobacillus ferrooxydans]KPV43873.1 hypothetical protein AN477_09910 [Alicyclobacillus ferrooxydans]
MRLRYVFGLILILLGGTVLANALGMADFSPWHLIVVYFWPVVFLLIGLMFFLGARVWSFSRIIMGLAFLAIGGLMTANRAGWLHIPAEKVWTLFWPVLLIVFGLQLLFSSRRDGRSWAILSGISRQHPGWKLRSSDYWTILGGVHLDLRTAEIQDARTTLEVTTVLGGAEILVPDDIRVICTGTSVLGGMQLFERAYGGVYTSHEAANGPVGDSVPVVRIHCTSVLGGVKLMAR